MVLSVVAVGEQYINNCLPYLDKFKNNGYDIKILTDKPEKFIGYDTQLYENKIFSYFDKLLFSLRLVEKYNTDVLYIDSDWIQNVNDVFIKNFNGSNNVLYYDNSTKAISYGLAASSTLNSSSNVLDYSYNMVLYDPLVTSQSYSPSIIQKYRSKWSSSPSVLLNSVCVPPIAILLLPVRLLDNALSPITIFPVP